MNAIYIIGVVLVAVGAALMAFAKININNVRDWLIWATTNAEKDLGSGTGQLKLRQVYDMFVNRFPWVARFVSFSRFGKMVDEALDSMKSMLASNKNVRKLVTGEEETHDDDSK